MKYLLQIYTAPTRLPSTQDEGEALIAAYNAFTESIVESGELVIGEQVDRAAGTVSVQVRDGQISTTEGPFTGPGEHLGGFYIVDAKDVNRAIELAAKIPNAQTGTVEVRSLVPR